MADSVSFPIRHREGFFRKNHLTTGRARLHEQTHTSTSARPDLHEQTRTSTLAQANWHERFNSFFKGGAVGPSACDQRDPRGDVQKLRTCLAFNHARAALCADWCGRCAKAEDFFYLLIFTRPFAGIGVGDVKEVECFTTLGR